jgi:hypothetical protein
MGVITGNEMVLDIRNGLSINGIAVVPEVFTPQTGEAAFTEGFFARVFNRPVRTDNRMGQVAKHDGTPLHGSVLGLIVDRVTTGSLLAGYPGTINRDKPADLYSLELTNPGAFNFRVPQKTLAALAVLEGKMMVNTPDDWGYEVRTGSVAFMSEADAIYRFSSEHDKSTGGHEKAIGILALQALQS